MKNFGKLLILAVVLLISQNAVWSADTLQTDPGSLQIAPANLVKPNIVELVVKTPQGKIITQAEKATTIPTVLSFHGPAGPPPICPYDGPEACSGGSTACWECMVDPICWTLCLFILAAGG